MNPLNIENILGSWKSIPYLNRGKNVIMNLDISADSIVFTGTMDDIEQPRMEFTYTIIPEQSDTIILESIIPQANNTKVEFKFRIENDDLLFTDPDQRLITLKKI